MRYSIQKTLSETITVLVAKKNHLVFYFFISLLMIDAGIANVGVNFENFLASNLGIGLFVFFYVVYIIFIFVLFRFIRSTISEMIAHNKSIKYSYNFTLITQLLISAVYGFVSYQMIFENYYNSFSLVILLILSLGLSMVMYSALSLQFIRWYTRSFDFVVLVFGMAFAFIFMSSPISLLSYSGDLLSRQLDIHQDSDLVFEHGEDFLFSEIIITFGENVDIISFILIWFSTVMLLWKRAIAFGKRKFWITALIPILYYLSYSVAAEYIYYSQISTMAFNLMYLYGFIFGKWLVAIIYYIVAKNLPKNIKNLREIMILTFLGFIVNSISIYHLVFQSLYPPFGLSNLSVLGLSSFMIYIGLFSTASFIAKDNKTRREISKFFDNEYLFIRKLGDAQRTKEMEEGITNVMKKSNETVNNESGLRSDLTSDEIRDYAESLMEELRNLK